MKSNFTDVLVWKADVNKMLCSEKKEKLKAERVRIKKKQFGRSGQLGLSEILTVGFHILSTVACWLMFASRAKMITVAWQHHQLSHINYCGPAWKVAT